MAPEYASEEYWNKFIESKSEAFDWLLESSTVFSIVKDIISEHAAPTGLLHVGFGNSDLTWNLPRLVEHASQVHNVDFAESAVSRGMQEEEQQISKKKRDDRIDEVWESEGPGTEESMTSCPSNSNARMRWSQVDLLSLESIDSTFSFRNEDSKDRYSLVIDKSTSDSVALGPDLSVNIPYRLSTNILTDESTSKTIKIHPVNLLAVHLAALTIPSEGRWVAISFSEDRFPFLPKEIHSKQEDEDEELEEVVNSGFPDPRSLWRLEKKWSVAAPPEAEHLNEPTAFRPEVLRWIYVLVRTEKLLSFHHDVQDDSV